MNSNNSTGFSGISDLFSKIDLDALRQQVGQNQSQIQEQTKSKRTLYQPKIKLPRFNIPQGYWWIAGILLVIWLASNDDNMKLFLLMARHGTFYSSQCTIQENLAKHLEASPFLIQGISLYCMEQIVSLKAFR